MGGFAACLWIYTEAVLCDGQESTQEDLKRRFVAIRESVSWVCEDALKDREWVTELTSSMHESEILVALNCEIEVPCVVQWGLLWFSSTTSLNRRFSDSGTQVDKYNAVINTCDCIHSVVWWIQHAAKVHAEIGSCGFSTDRQTESGMWAGS